MARRGVLPALAFAYALCACAEDGAPIDGGAARPDARAMDGGALSMDAAAALDARDTDDAAAPIDARAPAAPIVVAVVSDLNGSYGSTTYEASVHAAIDRVVALEPDLVLSTGDMVAGQQAGHDYRAMWRGFHDAVSDRLEAAGIPFAVTPGNHDASGYSSFAGERAIFVDEWSSRRPDVVFLDDTDYPLRYSFTMGPALFVSLDDTTIGPLSGEQRDWLEAQLVAGAAQPVKIVYGHIPLHAFAQGRETEILDDPATEALLVDHDVTAFVSGHHHAFYPGRRGALRVVSMACVGSGARRLLGESVTSPRSILLLEIDEDGVRTLDGLGGAGFDVPIDRATLPESVGTGANVVVRDDL
jgi:hypothetical protein